ncbi:MAG: hybrid sensor histidine kinase/response regulator, partial [Spirochaetales bacterium]|nr:hybrid sensor histidine kinase/response regulator [Spirochaetales bacterium]
MKYRRLRLCLAAAWAVALCVPAPAVAEDVVRFVNTGLREGLANASVSSMVQDAAGFVWIGTQGGLHRWDGRSFTLYENEPFDSTTLPHNLIQTMYMDDDGFTIWIGTYGGLTKFDTRTGEFSSWRHDSNDRASLANDVVVAVARDGLGRLWVGTLSGLDRLTEDGKGFIHYPVAPGQSGALAVGVIRSLYRDTSGELWVGSSGGGLYRYLPDTDSFKAYRANPDDTHALQSDYVFSIQEDERGDLWFGQWFFGVSKLDRKTGLFVNYPLEDGRVYFVNTKIPGSVFAGTWGGGLFELDRTTGETRRYRSNTDRQWSLPHDTIYSMLVDASGNAWIGTNGGGFSLLVRESDD